MACDEGEGHVMRGRGMWGGEGQVMRGGASGGEDM